MTCIAPFPLLCDLALDPANCWCIGCFGASGQFMRDRHEPASVLRGHDRIEIVTRRGGLRIVDGPALEGVAWDSLSADGDTWGHALAFCLPRGDAVAHGIVPLGHDGEALQDTDRGLLLFDLGVGAGQVRMCVRTGDPRLTGALHAAAGQGATALPSLWPLILQVQPQRVMLSPAGRIEVYQPLPLPDRPPAGGPLTLLLPKLAAKGMTHAATAPLPEPLHAVLTLYPPSPWRWHEGGRPAFDAAVDAAFAPHLSRFGLDEDAEIEHRLRAAVTGGIDPGAFPWPETRRGRAKARIVLRRLAAAGEARASAWRQRHDAAASRRHHD